MKVNKHDALHSTTAVFQNEITVSEMQLFFTITEFLNTLITRYVIFSQNNLVPLSNP